MSRAECRLYPYERLPAGYTRQILPGVPKEMILEVFQKELARITRINTDLS
jgi:hypothetical protein